jgi:hypothetical protein
MEIYPAVFLAKEGRGRRGLPVVGSRRWTIPQVPPDSAREDETDHNRRETHSCEEGVLLVECALTPTGGEAVGTSFEEELFNRHVRLLGTDLPLP